jgi:hypothetical protein
MEISVYLQGQDSARESAPHRATRMMMKLVLAADLAERIGQNAVRLTTPLSWKDAKTLARMSIVRRRIEMAPALPIREYPMNEICLSTNFQLAMRYPVEIARDQRSPYADWS